MEVSRIPDRPDQHRETALDSARLTPEAALAALASAYEFRLRALALGQLQDRQLAEEVVQDVLYRAFRILESGRPVNWAWLARGVILASRSEQRRAWRRRQVVTDPACLPDVTGPEPRGDLLDAVQALPPPYREATLLYYWAGFDVRETAQMLRVSEGTVKSRLARSRERLKRWLGAEDGGVRHGR
jgi:RNA polymerase sigma-70 factor (ECF subfamily)